MTRPIAATAADIIEHHRQRGLALTDLHDVYIGATGRIEQLPILTGNVSHFERIDGLRVVDWHEYYR